MYFKFLVYREEKSLRHIAMVAKFLDDNKPKRPLKSGFALFQTSLTYSISFNLSNAGKIFGVKSEGPYVSLEKEKQNFCVVYMLTYSIKWAHEIRKFHVVVLRQRLRIVQKSVKHVQRCFLPI